MGRVVAVFNNKGGVGKTSLCWNIADTLARRGKHVLLIDFDPQCNLSIAVLGEEEFVRKLPNENVPYGMTIRAYLQRFLQNTPGEEVWLHQGRRSEDGDFYTHQDVQLIAGDFWLNTYADSLSLGSDLLSGNGLSKYLVLRRMIEKAEERHGRGFDFTFIDLPPSFGALVRAAFYSANYFIVPCTSDNFSVYCVGLIGQMIPSFIDDWKKGLERFKSNNPNYAEYDEYGKPAFGGWIFNGFDTRKRKNTPPESGEKNLVQADEMFNTRIGEAVTKDLVRKLDNNNVLGYKAIASNIPERYQIGHIEDANVLIQNSLLQNVPLGELGKVKPVTTLQARSSWSPSQSNQICLLRSKFESLCQNIERICV